MTNVVAPFLLFFKRVEATKQEKQAKHLIIWYDNYKYKAEDLYYMTHKKFHRIRWISMIVIVTLIICGNIAGRQLTNGEQTQGSIVPIILAAVIGLTFILLFGRIICGFFCPLGLLQDIVWKVTEKLHLPKLPRDERFMKVINIFNRVFLVFFICGIFSLVIVGVFFSEVLSKASAPLLIFIVVPIVMIIANSFARRFFCNVCPIGSFIGLFERLNVIKLEKDCSACTLCGACYEACPMRIKNIYTETENTNVSSAQCMYCGECIKKCPEDNALAITVCGKTVYKSSQEDFLNNQMSDVSTKARK